MNIKRRSALYADRLQKSRGTREHLAIVLGAIGEIATTREFNRHLTELTGWKNLKSWVRWAGRSLEPAMLTKMRYEALVNGLTPLMLEAGMRHAYFAERFIEELILICNAEQDKADISFIIGQAFTLFGPLLAPLSAAAGQAAGAGLAGVSTKGAISVGKGLAQMGVTAGGKAVALDPSLAAGMSSSSSVAPVGFVAPTTVQKKPEASEEERYHYSVNPMQYALCLFKYLTNLESYSPAERIVIIEFGGVRKVHTLYEFLKHPID
jgi:hypothetical protein